MSRYDWLIVGAGITGCTLAERLAASGMRVLLIERREEPGGHCHDSFDASGVLIHKYGPHIFHTDNAAVYAYLSRFTEWHPYAHHVEADLGGRHVPLPCNLNTIRDLWPGDEGERLERALLSRFAYGTQLSVFDLAGLPEFSDSAAFILETLFEGYSEKQWGRWRGELDASVFARVPIRLSRDNRYFTDTFQGIPSGGYTEMMTRMVSGSPRIELLLGQEYDGVSSKARYNGILFTGRIDEFFDYSRGPLPYRSVRFQHDTVQSPSVLQRTGTVNYPGLTPAHTRSTEFRILTGQQADFTTLCREFPVDADDTNEAMYPVPCDTSRAVLDEYAQLAARESRARFCGRLGSYRYLNMDQAVEAALDLAATITGDRSSIVG